jgi:hypothetical protein
MIPKTKTLTNVFDKYKTNYSTLRFIIPKMAKKKLLSKVKYGLYILKKTIAL